MEIGEEADAQSGEGRPAVRTADSDVRVDFDVMTLVEKAVRRCRRPRSRPPTAVNARSTSRRVIRAARGPIVAQACAAGMVGRPSSARPCAAGMGHNMTAPP